MASRASRPGRRRGISFTGPLAGSPAPLAGRRAAPGANAARQSTRASLPPAPPLLRDQLSAVLREELLSELPSLADEAAAWAHKRFAAKNSLIDPDARMVEEAFAHRLKTLAAATEPASPTDNVTPPEWLGPLDPEPFTIPAGVDKSALPIGALIVES